MRDDSRDDTSAGLPGARRRHRWEGVSSLPESVRAGGPGTGRGDGRPRRRAHAGLPAAWMPGPTVSPRC
ncbi:hypothetical protein [Nocardioides convexus]|uniref:hypothetical protein n=1 Tax=Nocardioides convexus TaxID=2712224 RepID=UPI002418B4A0|nr:hypothetical protein [Nocardioides convexus]